MDLGADHLRLKAARYLVCALWLHVPLIMSAAYFNQSDPLPPAVTALILASFASAFVLRRSLAPLGAVLVALAFGGIASVLGDLLQVSPWQGVGLVYTAAAMAFTLSLISGPAVLAFAGVALLPDLALQGLVGALPPDANALVRAGVLAGEAGLLAVFAQALAGVLHKAQASTCAARHEAEGLWQSRTNAQIEQAAFITALFDRITALAQNPTNPIPASNAFPFAYAEVERAVDLLSSKLEQGGDLPDQAGLAGFAQIDLAAATVQLAGCLHDLSARLKAIHLASQGDYRANVFHQMRFDLAHLTDQAHQTAAFAADLSVTAQRHIKTPLLASHSWADGALALGNSFDKKLSPRIFSKQGLFSVRAA